MAIVLHIIMLAVVITILISYLILNLFGYVVHWSLHQSWAGQFNNSHMTHHLKLYPANDFSSDIYRNAGKDSTPKFFAIAAIPFVITPILLGIFSVLPLHLIVIILIMEAIMGFLHDYLHDSFHINNHWLSTVPFIKNLYYKWMALHYQHHVDMSKNFGIFTFFCDRLFGSFKRN